MLFLLLFHLHAFELQIPREQDQLRPRCEASFPEALDKKEAYENRVRVNCTHGLPGAEMKDLRESFIENCVVTAKSLIRKMDGAGRLSVDEELVSTMFDYAYRPIFQKVCMDRELSHLYQRRRSEPENTGYSPTISEVYSNR